MLEVWYTAAASMPPAPALAMLSGQEADRLWSLHRPQDRAEYARAHVLLREVLRQHLGPGHIELDRRPCPCCDDHHGRPYVRRPSTKLEFSLTHHNGLIAVALCDRGAVGIDTEGTVDASTLDELGHRLHPAEQRELADAPHHERATLFTRVWARKEAYLKAIGTGIGRDVRLDCVAPGRPELHPEGWVFHELRLRHRSMTALCAPTGSGTPVVRDASVFDA